MYLSRIRLTAVIAQHSQLGLMLRDSSYGMHRLLWDLFPEGQRFLFREERAHEQRQGAGHQPLYYVLSDSCPQQDSPLFEVESKPFEPQLAAGDRLAFRLRANPVVTRKRDGKARSGRHDVLMDAQRRWLQSACQARDLAGEGSKGQLKRRLAEHADFHGPEGGRHLEAALRRSMDEAARAWLTERAPKHGYRLTTGAGLEATGYRWQALPEKGRQAGFASIDYEGVLEVIEPDSFLAMLCRGLGPAKGFGCGLMLIRRISCT